MFTFPSMAPCQDEGKLNVRFRAQLPIFPQIFLQYVFHIYIFYHVTIHFSRITNYTPFKIGQIIKVHFFPPTTKVSSPMATTVFCAHLVAFHNFLFCMQRYGPMSLLFLLYISLATGYHGQFICGCFEQVHQTLGS